MIQGQRYNYISQTKDDVSLGATSFRKRKEKKRNALSISEEILFLEGNYLTNYRPKLSTLTKPINFKKYIFLPSQA